MIGILTALIILSSLVVIGLVLIQDSKGGGISAGMGGSSVNQMIGVQNAGDILEKLTWGITSAMLVFVLIINMLANSNGSSSKSSVLKDVEKESKKAVTK